MRLKNYLNEAKTPKMKASERSKINKEIYKVTKQNYFKKIPLNDIFEVLEKYGYVPLQEDNTYWSGMLMGGRKQTEQVYFDIGIKNSKDENGMYTPIDNARLVLSYYIMPNSGKYEIVSYVG